MRPSRLARRMALASIALALLGAGCATEEIAARMQVGERAAVAVAAAGARKASGARDRYVAVRGTKKTAPGSAFIQLTPDVWAPFDVSVHTGLFDPSQMSSANGTRACLEIDDVGFSVYFDVCAVYGTAPAGWTLSAFTGAPTVGLPGSVFLAGPEIELRIETDGSTLRFHGRLVGDVTWSKVASTPWPGQSGPLEAAFGVSPILKGTLVGFDDPSFASAAPPGLPMGADAVAAAANDALLEGLGAYLALDGASPDFPAATAGLTAAANALADAQTLLASLPQEATAKKAGRDFAKGAKKLARAQGDVAEQDADGALKNLGKAAAAVEKAVLRLVPQPLGSS